MREICDETLTAANMPDSLVASATPSEIAGECAAYISAQQLADYVRKFSSLADTLSSAQVLHHSHI